MKNFFSLLVLAVLLASGNALHAQGKKSTTEVFYFKANLACCKARACNALEADVQRIIEQNFPNGEVSFTEVKLADPENAELVERFGAGSQTLIVISQKKKKENVADLSDVLKQYNRNLNIKILETELVEQIKTTML